jgi:hypothetical protein
MRPWHGLVGLAAAIVLAWLVDRRRSKGARIMADEARMEPTPVVY